MDDFGPEGAHLGTDLLNLCWGQMQRLEKHEEVDRALPVLELLSAFSLDARGKAKVLFEAVRISGLVEQQTFEH